MNIQFTPQYNPTAVNHRLGGDLKQSKSDWTRQLKKANLDTFQCSGKQGATVAPSAPSSLSEESSPSLLLPYSPDGQHHMFRCWGSNCIYSGRDGRGQDASVEYTADSTKADPIVRISIHSQSGNFEKIVHINDINPGNATYPELCALVCHKYENGGPYTPCCSYLEEYGVAWGLPLDVVEYGDWSKPQDYTALYQKWDSTDWDKLGWEIHNPGEPYVRSGHDSSDDEKPDELPDLEDKEEGFWEARARRHKEFMELQAEAAGKRRMAQKLPSDEPVSADWTYENP